MWKMAIDPPMPWIKRSDAERARQPSRDFREMGKESIEAVARDIISTTLNLRLAPARADYLYVILPLVSAETNGVEHNLVLYPPEFLFVYDFGFSAHVGLTAIWKTDALGRGDPEFPNFKPPLIWSISALDYSHLVYPDSPGEIIFALTPGTTLDSVKDKLAAYSLTDIEELVPGVYLAKCTYFEELAICNRMTSELDFIRYAETNHNNRLIDFSPGWILKRLT
jgi:hypothetical protein